MYAFYPVPRAAGADDRPLIPECLNKEPYKDLFAKWGLSQAGEGSLRVYRYAYNTQATSASDAEAVYQELQTVPTVPSSSLSAPTRAGAGSSNPVTAAALRFHHGMANDFLSNLFSSPLVLTQLEGAAAETCGALHFRPLTCHWTTLEPLREALVNAKVVRQARCTDGQDGDEEEGQRTQGDMRLPTVKCAEELLPHGEVISDELRALFLQAHHRHCGFGAFSDTRIKSNGKDEDGNVDNDDDDEENEADDDEDMWGAMPGAKLPLRLLRGVFDKTARGEFLYHLLWRLIAGGGPMNQYEDDAAVYFDVARQLFRSLITSLHVREVADGAAATEDDVTALESPSPPAGSMRYEAVVDACVYEVFSVPNVRLFPTSDGVVPSNLNYCYVLLNPSEQTVCVWYHRC